MTNKKTVTARKVPRKVRRVVARKPAAAASRAKAQPQWTDVLDKARDSYREGMLAVGGAIEKARKAREERFEEWVAEGRRVEPKVKKAIEGLMTRLQPKGVGKFDLARLKIDPKKFDRKAMEARFDEGMTKSLHRMGLPTRKEVQALARKVDKLALQHA